jgi:hypothetical protein
MIINKFILEYESSVMEEGNEYLPILTSLSKEDLVIFIQNNNKDIKFSGPWETGFIKEFNRHLSKYEIDNLEKFLFTLDEWFDKEKIKI